MKKLKRLEFQMNVTPFAWRKPHIQREDEGGYWWIQIGPLFLAVCWI